MHFELYAKLSNLFSLKLGLIMFLIRFSSSSVGDEHPRKSVARRRVSQSPSKSSPDLFARELFHVNELFGGNKRLTAFSVEGRGMPNPLATRHLPTHPE